VKRNHVFCRARLASGRWVSAHTLDLDDESFRAFFAGILFRSGPVVGIKDEHVKGDPVVLRVRGEAVGKYEGEVS
jgi:hypothetical protein